VNAREKETAEQAGLRAVIAYKIIKGLLTTVSGFILGGALLFGFGPDLQAHAARVHEHATGAWALHAAELLSKITQPRWLRFSALALELDGAVSFFEAWALKEGHSWGPWLVVGITALFLPAEAYELWRHPRPSRVVLLLANLLILVFLAFYARAHAARPPKAKAEAAPPGLEAGSLPPQGGEVDTRAHQGQKGAGGIG